MNPTAVDKAVALEMERDSLVEQLEASEEYAKEGWAWLGAALHALGVTHVFEIPDWKENLRKSNAQMAAEKAVAESYPASGPPVNTAAGSCGTGGFPGDPFPASEPPVSSRGGTPSVSSSVPPAPNQERES